MRCPMLRRVSLPPSSIHHCCRSWKAYPPTS